MDFARTSEIAGIPQFGRNAHNIYDT
jgi:hypothetical protein